VPIAAELLRLPTLVLCEVKESCEVASLTVLSLLTALCSCSEGSTADSALSTRSDAAKLVPGLTSSNEVGTWVAGQDKWQLSTLAEEAVNALQPLVNDSPDGSTAVSALSKWCTEQHIDAHGRRALMIALATTPNSPRSAEDSAPYLSAAAVANLLSADTATQNAVLRTFLSPRSTSTSTNAVAAPALPPALSALSFITSAETDILTALKLTHAALWLRDLSPLAEIVQKHALSTFRRTKSSIEVLVSILQQLGLVVYIC
jgi:hypothetical protein